MIIKSGCDHCHNKIQERKVIQTNVGALITIMLIVSFYVGFLFTNNQGLLLASNVQLPFLILYPIIPFLNRQGLFNLARWLFFLISMTTICVTIFLAHGTILKVHYFFLLLSLLPIAFFNIKQWYSVLFLFVANMSLFYFFYTHPWPHHYALDELSNSLITLLQNSIIWACFAAVILQLLICEYYSYQNEQQLQKLADKDLLTGLFNRRVFIEQLQKRLNKRKQAYLLLLDIDFFKRINDTAGHDAGDRALVLISTVLRQHVEDSELVARIGGEEFAMILTDLTDINDRAEAIRKSIAKMPFIYGRFTFDLTISIGICQLKSYRQHKDILRAADKALYHAKAKGRNCVVPYLLEQG